MGDNGCMADKETRISVRIDADTKARLTEAAELVGVDETTMVKRCVEALLREIESEGCITFPISITPARPKRQSNPGSYPSHKPNASVMHDQDAGKTKKSKAA